MTERDDTVERPRGIFSPADRKYLLYTNLENGSERSVRHRIRTRLANAYLDGEWLPYVSPQDHEQAFSNALEQGGSELKVALQHHVQFIHNGLASQNINFVPILRRGIESAKERQAAAAGQLVETTVDFEISTETVPTDDLLERAEREKLSANAVRALISNSETEFGVADAILNRRRVFSGDGFAPGGSEADPEREAQIYEEVVNVLDEQGIGSWDEYLNFLSRIPEDHEFQELLAELDEVATPLDWSEGETVTQKLERMGEPNVVDEYRPPDAGDDWDPSTDRRLHRFIALREAGLTREDWIENAELHTYLDLALDLGGIAYLRWTDDDEEWDQLKEAAEFDPEEHDLETLRAQLDRVREKLGDGEDDDE